MKLPYPSNRKAFTLIELLLVISVIGVLSGITIGVIKPSRQRDVAAYGVELTNMNKLIQAVGSYCQAEGSCPATTDWGLATSVLSQYYIKQLPPDDPNTAASEVFYYAVSGTNNFAIWVQKSSDTTKYLKYHSAWGKIMLCNDTAANKSNSEDKSTCTNL